MHSDVFVDGCLQFDYAGEGTTTNAFVCDVAKEPLDHVELGRTGGCEMDMKAWVLGQPSLDLWVLVGCVVIHDQVQFLGLWRLAINHLEKLQPLLMPMEWAGH